MASREYMRKWRLANKDKIAQHNQTYSEKNRDRISARANEWYAKNRERGLASRRNYYRSHVDEFAAYGKQRRLNSSDLIKEQKHREYEKHMERYKYSAKIWRETNPERAKRNSKAWKEANPRLVAAHNALRRACKLQRTPSWANLEAIEAIYEACPLGYHVDHIIPLRGKIVSGLHVENNLQYLTKAENLQKYNRYG